MNNENVKIMEKLINKLNEASDAYYNGKDEIMSNYEWDTMFDELAQLEKETGIILPDSPTQKVGADEIGAKNEILNSTTTFGGGIYSRTVKVYSFI